MDLWITSWKHSLLPNPHFEIMFKWIASFNYWCSSVKIKAILNTQHLILTANVYHKICEFALKYHIEDVVTDPSGVVWM